MKWREEKSGTEKLNQNNKMIIKGGKQKEKYPTTAIIRNVQNGPVQYTSDKARIIRPLV